MEHKDLEVWKTGIELVKSIYAATQAFPKEELYGLTSQIRRCAVSIPSNIAEGAARNYDKEMVQFLYIVLGSLAELETQIIIAIELKYTNESPQIFGMIETEKKLILGLIKYLKKKDPK